MTDGASGGFGGAGASATWSSGASFSVVREPDSPGEPTIGELLVEGLHFCYTLELPWRDNEQNVSCIPVGIYRVQMLASDKFKRLMPFILNVPGRTAEEIHPCNKVSELLGCIGVGDTRGPNRTLAFPARPASDRLNAWLESWGGRGLLTVSYRVEASPPPAGAQPPAPPA
jgi:hypothetical protein